MEWRDEGVIIGIRRHGETSVILEAMTAEHGRHLGLVRGGRSRRHAPVLQPGNSVSLVWRARLDQHLGIFSVEPLQLRAASVLDRADALHALNTITSHLRLLAERDPHPGLYEATLVILDHLQDCATSLALLARFEIALLSELGFGLDLSACAATGATEELIWVSPKSGRAVCRHAGQPYAGRLLSLPAFLKNIAHEPGKQDIRNALILTEHFLQRDVFGPRGSQLPEARQTLIAMMDTSGR